MLSAAQVADFERDGFLVLPDLIEPADCEAVRARTAEQLAAVEPDEIMAAFSTNEADSHVRDRYFLDSGPGMSFFWEAEAIDADGRLTRDKDVAVNKFGHAMHDLDDVHDHFCRRTGLAEVTADLGYDDPLLIQSMYIFKQPLIGGEVVMHNDHAFLWTTPMRTLGYWIALEPADATNGCLWAQPGSHRNEQWRRFERTDEGGTRMSVWEDAPPAAGLVPLEVDTGTVIALDGMLSHWSDTNRSDRSRHAYTLHVIDADAEWAAHNWLQRPAELPFRGF